MELSERARIYIKICKDRTRKEPSHFTSAADCCYAGTLKCNEKKYDEAMKLYEKALSKNDASPEKIHFLMACCHAESGNAEEAVKSLGEAIDANELNLYYAINSSSFAAIKEDPLFQDLVKKKTKKKKKDS
jgi:tetratricopeptide (TPR) repeat protein